jgi:formylglycine-generating enzyme required for sulfatase activity
MGDATNLFSALPLHDDLGPHLVVLSPFFMDATEMTVATFRKTKLPVVAWNDSSTGGSLLDFCTVTPAPGPKETFPATCMSWVTAHAACAAKGSVLPTEAQFEYVASNLGRHRFPWGDDLPSCGDAIFGRTGYGLFAADTAPCKPADAPGGPTPVGTATLDRVALPTGTITDLAGNIGELTRDEWNRHDEPCWNKPGVYRDPVCVGKSAADGAGHAERGGDWLVPRGQLARTTRSAAIPSLLSPEIGFRCARAAAIP